MLSKEVWCALIIGSLLGGLISIPIQLLTGLMFPRVQRWSEDRAKARAFLKSSRTRKEYEEAYYFVKYPHKMTHYFLNRGFELLRLAVFLFFAYGLFLVAPSVTSTGGWGGAASVAPMIGIGFLLFVISKMINDLHAIYYRVEFWGEYRKEVLQGMPELENLYRESTTSSNE